MIKIAIASGKGGTGKTFLSTNLFVVMRQSGFHVAMVDCDAEVPNAFVFVGGKPVEVWKTKVLCPEIDVARCALCGICADHCTFNAITCIPGAGYIRVQPDLCHGCGACLFACPRHAVTKAWKVVGKVTAYGDGNCPQFFEARMKEGERSPVPVIRDAIRRGERSGADYLLLDAPPGCSCPFVNTVADAGFVLLVSEPTPFGLSDLKHTVEVLRRLHKPFGVVVNRADIGDGTMKEWLRSEEIALLAEIPYSGRIASIYAKGGLAVEEDPEMEKLFANLMKRIVWHEDSGH